MSRKYAQNELVTRSYRASFRTVADDTAKGVIEGLPIVFDSPTRMVDWFGDEYDEVISRGALDKADLKDVRLFVNHDMSKIALARSKNGNENSTMSFEITDEGLKIRAELDLDNNAEARALYSAIQRGDMDGMSFAFRVDGDTWTGLDDDIPLRTIDSISIVHEVSVVNYPAYPQTSVTARSEGGSPQSPLVEARKKHSEETEIELEKLRNTNIIRGV